LKGAEVKSLRDAKVQMRDAYARVERGEMLLLGIHITPYAYSHSWRPEPDRARKLLLHKRQIVELGNRLALEGLVLIPLDIHFVNGRAKVDLGLARPRKLHDKRNSIADRDAKRDIDRALSRHRSGKASLDV
jgi:SsrA-binding protein